MTKTTRKVESHSNINDDPFYSNFNQTLLRKSAEEMERTGGTIHDIDLDV